MASVGDLGITGFGDVITIQDNGNQSWATVSDISKPTWELKRYVMRFNGDAVGIYEDVVNGAHDITFTWFRGCNHIGEKFVILEAEEITEAELGTHKAFESLPTFHTFKSSGSGILLTLPEE